MSPREEMKALDILTAAYPSTVTIHQNDLRGPYRWSVSSIALTDREPHDQVDLGLGHISVRQNPDGCFLHLGCHGPTRADALVGAADIALRMDELLAKVEPEQVGEPASAQGPGQADDEVDLVVDAGPKGDGGQASHATAPPVATPSAARRFVEWLRSMGFS